MLINIIIKTLLKCEYETFAVKLIYQFKREIDAEIVKYDQYC